MTGVVLGMIHYYCGVSDTVYSPVKVTGVIFHNWIFLAVLFGSRLDGVH